MSSVSSSATLPGPLSTTSVRPVIVVIVAPEVTTVVPSVGAEYPEIVVQVTPSAAVDAAVST